MPYRTGDPAPATTESKMLSQCQAAASNFVAADKCADAMQSAIAASPLAAVAIVGAVIAAAIFATLTYNRF